MLQDMLQDVSDRGDLEQEMLQDVSGRGTWSNICFKMSLAEVLGPRNACGRSTWSKTCFRMSLAEALGASNASRCLW